MKQYEQMNYYELLGVPETASAEEIRAAYLELSRIYHPDSTFYDEIIACAPTDDNRKLFQIITTAFGTLVDPDKRIIYDRTLSLGAERRKSTGRTAPGSRTLSLHRSMMTAQMGEMEMPSYEEIEGLTHHTKPVADLIRKNQGSRLLPVLIALLLIAIATVVINLITQILSTRIFD